LPVKDPYFQKFLQWIKDISIQAQTPNNVTQSNESIAIIGNSVEKKGGFFNFIWAPKKDVFVIDPENNLKPIYNELNKIFPKFNLKILNYFPEVKDQTPILYIQSISARLETEIDQKFINWRIIFPQACVVGIEIRFSIPQTYNGMYYENLKTTFFAFYYHSNKLVSPHHNSVPNIENFFNK
jgi:hypothetical protein